MKVAITGHTNIEKALGVELKHENGQKYDSVVFEKVYNQILENLKFFCKKEKINFKDLTLISGMARGVDEVFAILAIRNQLSLILSIPATIRWHKGRSLSRGMRAQAVYYDRILAYENIVSIHEISKDYNDQQFPLVNLARNQHMVDIADGVFSYKAYDSTGTNDCISRAKKVNKYLVNLAEN